MRWPGRPTTPSCCNFLRSHKLSHRCGRQTHLVRHFVQNPAEFSQDFARVRFQLCPRQGEHGPVLVIYDLDAQPFGSNVQQQLFAKLAHGRVGFDQTFQPGFQILEPRPVAAFQLALRSLEINRLIASISDLPVASGQVFPLPGSGWYGPRCQPLCSGSHPAGSGNTRKYLAAGSGWRCLSAT